MSATIDNQPASAFDNQPKPELAEKVDSQLYRVVALRMMKSHEGYVTVNEDRSVRIVLRREEGTFWPSAMKMLPNVPTSLCVDEKSFSVFVGMVTGAVQQFAMGEDFNRLDPVRLWHSHTHSVTAIVYSESGKEIFTCSRDKSVAWHSVETGCKIGCYTVDSPCTVMQYDPTTSFAFVGDYSGSVFVLRIVGNNAQLVSKLSAHTSTITDLAWDSGRQLLFSASTDTLVIMWDIGGKKGNCYELNGHNSKLACLALDAQHSRLISADESGHLVCWDLNAKRNMAPAWKENDKCELCDVPFFWNVRMMWDRKTMGVRRHHCRTCGSSVCSDCCNHYTVFPSMGFEKPVRICKTCHQKMQSFRDQFDFTPLATQADLRQGIMDMDYNGDSSRLATVGYSDRSIMVWNMIPMLR